MSQSLELLNRHPAKNILSFEIMMPGAPKSPGTLKRRTAPIGVRIKPNEKVDLCKVLDCDWKTADEALKLSPQAQYLLNHQHMMRIDSHGGEETAKIATRAKKAAEANVLTPHEKSKANAEAAEKKVAEEAKAAEEAAVQKAIDDDEAKKKAEEEAANPPPPPPPKALADMDKRELLEVAKGLGVKPKRGMKVKTLIGLIEEKQAEAAAPEEPPVESSADAPQAAEEEPPAED